MNITLQLQIWNEGRLEKLIDKDQYFCFIPLTFSCFIDFDSTL